MPALTEADTIRILVATDNHVGYAELDPVRKEDSWRSFDEVMTLARERDVDMVLLAGDLFHDNKPSRQAMYQVMRSLRTNCLGEKPCELEMLSDRTEAFEGAFDHVNYEDPDINVAIPVFSIHGNHDDPTGDGHLAALDILQMSGFVNYYGRTHESDNIQVKPVLLQKGRTKLALFGMSNVRDERLFRTFRDGKVKFFRPGTQSSDWFNLLSVHQNRHAYTETSYLPENFLPDFMDLVIWGHEHECLIEPRHNAETNFDVMQPGSSVATSLDKSEAEAKHVAILSITGREYKSEPIRLKSVRPFKTKDIVLAEDPVAKKLIKKDDHRTELTRRLTTFVDELIDEANAEWREQQDEDAADETPPLPLIRLRVEYSPPDGITGAFETENPQRFSNRFQGRVANTHDVIAFHRRRATSRRAGATIDEPDDAALHRASAMRAVKVDKLVREFLAKQSLTILPQNSFGDAVMQFVEKDDPHAVRFFVDDSLRAQVEHLLALEADDEEEAAAGHAYGERLLGYKAQMEELFAKGARREQTRLRPKPSAWDSDEDGHWADQREALPRSDAASDEDEASREPTPVATSRGRAAAGRGGKAATGAKAASTRKAAAPKKTAAATKSTRGRKAQVVEEEDEDDDDDIIMDNADGDDAEEASQPLFVESPPRRGARGRPAAKPAPAKPAATTKAPAKAAPKPAPKAAPAAKRQTTLRMTQATQPSQASSRGTGVGGRASARRVEEISDDDDSDGGFEPAPRGKTRTR